MIPDPRPSKGPERPLPGRGDVAAVDRPFPQSSGLPPVALVRTPRGWSVVSPAGADRVGDLVEGLSLADVVAEEMGTLTEPDRTTRRSARGTAAEAEGTVDPTAARIAALERTVAQLEHALATRVSTERAIGVLAERNGLSPRAAFEALRKDARSQGRAVAELAREVLESLDRDAGPDPSPETAACPAVDRRGAAPGEREQWPTPASALAAADGPS